MGSEMNLLKPRAQDEWNRIFAAAFASLMTGVMWLALYLTGHGDQFVSGATCMYYWLHIFNTCGGRTKW